MAGGPAPARSATGLHVRASNAMARTRDGLLDGTMACILRDGLRGTTMAAIAIRAGVAKATLYNHFRTRQDVLVALVAREVDRVAALAVQAARERTLSDGLDRAAAEVGQIPAVRRLAATEPGALSGLLAELDGPASAHVRAKVAELLAAGGVVGAGEVGIGEVGTGAEALELHARVDLVLRWLATQLASPAEPDLRVRTARLLAAIHELSAPVTADSGGTST